MEQFLKTLDGEQVVRFIDAARRTNKRMASMKPETLVRYLIEDASHAVLFRIYRNYEPKDDGSLELFLGLLGGDIIRCIPAELQTEKVRSEALSYRGSNIPFIPKKERTYEHYLLACRSLDRWKGGIPVEYRTWDVMRDLIDMDPVQFLLVDRDTVPAQSLHDLLKSVEMCLGRLSPIEERRLEKLKETRKELVQTISEKETTKWRSNTSARTASRTRSGRMSS